MVHVTTSTKSISEKDIQREWHIVDMDGQVLGRAVNKIATLLQGKHKSTFAPYLDAGDYVVVINAKKLKVTGSKADDKIYSYYSGYPGGQKVVPFKTLLEKKPTEIVSHAVLGMLPKNKLRDRRMTRLYIFPDSTHPYEHKLGKKQ